MIEAVIFDVDGTLIDSVDFHALAWQKVFEKHGKKIKFYEIRRQIGKGGDQLLPEFFTAKQIKEFGKKMEEERVEIFKRLYLPKIKAFPKVPELFKKLKRDKKRVVLASSATDEEVGKYKKIARIENLIEEQTSSDDAEKSKPHPDIFSAALEKLGKINKRNVVVIGDTAYDAEAAAEIRLKVIGVCSGGWTKSELMDAGCAEVYQDIADLLRNYKTSILGSK